MTSRPGSRREHVRFCEVEGWATVRNARGKPVRHHITFELAVPNGNVLRTRISRPANSERYGPRLWSVILSEQLGVTEEQFWDCVDRGVPPVRAGATQPDRDALPAQLVYQLIHRVGLPESEVAAMRRDEAVARMNEYWTSRSSSPPSPR